MPAMTETLTPQRIAQIVRPIARRYGISELYLFGSMARGDGNDQSDVDFIYSLPDVPGRYRVMSDFRAALREALNRDVDLTRKEYVTDGIQSDPLAELQRRTFVENINSHPLYRIV